MHRSQGGDHRSEGGLADEVGLLQRILQDIEEILGETTTRAGRLLAADKLEDARRPVSRMQSEDRAAGTAAGHQG